jgi:hypothetical protein
MLERSFLSNVKNNNHPVGALIVGLSDRLEPVLASGVPDVQLYCLFIYTDIFDLEIHPDRGQKGVVEDIIRKSKKNVTFSHRGVANDEYFKNMLSFHYNNYFIYFNIMDLT